MSHPQPPQSEIIGEAASESALTHVDLEQYKSSKAF